ncbi:unnamed protein product [Psylliodes chrysocephalus]|uniref:Uncharacterized protein n=1 Tax=Psylliodes chrysocephalus TaxID=3402493 RepID=A0A9P0CWV0_9CUCU|nr:unnamed protein product [Psylliodes chrysocephala]
MFLEATQDMNIDWANKCIAICSDGAKAMTVQETLEKTGQRWILNPFLNAATNEVNLSTKLKENMLELSTDGMLHLEFKSVNLDTFWLKRKTEYPELTTEALKCLIPFVTSYLCELTFSSMAQIKKSEDEFDSDLEENEEEFILGNVNELEIQDLPTEFDDRFLLESEQREINDEDANNNEADLSKEKFEDTVETNNIDAETNYAKEIEKNNKKKLSNVRWKKGNLFLNDDAKAFKGSEALEWEVWENTERVTLSRMESTLQLSNERQKRKFNRIQTKYSETLKTHMKQTVINLSNRPLMDNETSLLRKFQHNLTDNTYRRNTNTEAGIKKLPSDVKEEVRSESKRILQKAKPPKSSISRGKKAAIRSRNENENIIILPTNKGNTTVVMSTSDYSSKLNALVYQDTYRKLTIDPTQKIFRKTTKLIKE